MKPSELSPHTSGVMADLIARYMDPQAFLVVQGGQQETTKLLEQPFNHIFYTGGGKVGSIVMAAAAKHLTPVTLELGASRRCSSTVPRTSTSPRGASPGGGSSTPGRPAWHPTMCSQRPTSSSRWQERSPSRHAVLRLRPATFRQFRTHHHARHFDRLTALLPDPKSPATGRTVCGGNTRRDDLYIAPTVLLGVKPDALVMQEEIFGPILPILEVADAKAAVEFITPGHARWRPTRSRAARGTADVRARSQLRSAGIQPAAWPSDLQSAAVRRRGSFGHGLISRKAGFLEFSHVKTVVGKPAVPDTLSLVYPPYDGLKKILISASVIRRECGSGTRRTSRWQEVTRSASGW